MAIRLAESLAKQQKFDRDDVVQVYYNWYRGPPFDAETAFDTGSTWLQTMRHFSKGKTIEEASKLVAASNSNAGINAAHRQLPLACCGFIKDDELSSVSAQESAISHNNPISIEVASVYLAMCRSLILGQSWKEALDNAKKKAKSLDVKNALNGIKEFHQLSIGGYAPATLEAALFFAKEDKTFTEIIEESVQFAGNSNYCPVLVGALVGAKLGYSKCNFQPSDLEHCSVALRERLQTVSSLLEDTWKEGSHL
eukprot:TRINITY_DN16376_c0_g1_i2.p1 TRINITY_DN16376_c0_g1~~TRINITY_DN16376_c0_g1_i2.p1  ORF type:complete len:253 (+),score=50.29 TRINITY_DN16376_c0_g1_i2:158-916(+)